MTACRVVAGVLLAAVLEVFASPTATSQPAPSSSCNYIDAYGRVVQAACPDDVTATTGAPGEGGGHINYTPYAWTRTQLHVGDETPSGAPVTPGDCERQATPPPDPTAPPGAPPPAAVTEYGTIWLVVMTNIETGDVVAERVWCRFPDEPPPPIPPSPPTPGQVGSRIVDLLVAEPAHSPLVRGLTGLETWLWCTGGSQVATAPGTLDGWTYVATVTRGGIQWGISGPETLRLTGSGCGSEQEPSARWTPNLIGEYTITSDAVWTGSYTAIYNWAGTIITAGPISMGTVVVSSEPVSFDVIESPGVLVN